MLGFALSCSAPAAFACEGDEGCSLNGQPGACVNGNCAYPSDGCASGWAFPAGAPGGLAGACADVELGTTTAGSSEPPSLSSESSTGAVQADSSTDSSTDSTTQFLDGTTGSTGMPAASSGGGDSSSTATGAPMTSGGSTGGCNSIVVDVQALADTFAAEGCKAFECFEYNYGSSELEAVGWPPQGGQWVMLVTFDLDSVASEQFMALTAVNLLLHVDDLDDGFNLNVSSLSSAYDWAEGMGEGEPAQDGESCWAFAQHPDAAWPVAGPPAAAAALLGEAAETELMGDALEIPLDAMTWLSEIQTGNVSMILWMSQGDGGVDVFSRESMLPPVLQIIGC